MALKLDMSKAYDRVEWCFLEKLMRKMGFHERWINLTMICVKTVTYSILVNGEPRGLIHPSRGIRQGDPLPPFLFLLCTEGLNGLIKQAKVNGDIHGFSLCRRGPKLTHLLFTDDSLLFCRATVEECGHVLDILKNYEKASGQKVNGGKTSLFFSKSIPNETKSSIKQALGPLFTSGKGKEGKLQLHQRKGMEKTPRLGRKATFTSRKGSLDQGSNPGYTNIYYRVF